MSSEALIKRYLDEMREGIKHDLDEHRRDIEDKFDKRVKRMEDRSIQSHEETRKQVSGLSLKVDELWRTVKKEEPPPPEAGSGLVRQKLASSPGEKPMEDQLSAHEEDIATLEGNVIAIHGKVDTLAEDVATIKDLQVKQTQHMGVKIAPDERGFFRKLGDGLIWMIKEPEGRKFSMSMFAALTGLITAVGTTYALITGRLPLPTSKAPTVQQSE